MRRLCSAGVILEVIAEGIPLSAADARTCVEARQAEGAGRISGAAKDAKNVNLRTWRLVISAPTATAQRTLKRLENATARAAGAVLHHVDLEHNTHDYSEFYHREYTNYNGGSSSSAARA